MPSLAARRHFSQKRDIIHAELSASAIEKGWLKARPARGADTLAASARRRAYKLVARAMQLYTGVPLRAPPPQPGIADTSR